MKKDYISPQAELLLLKMETGVCYVSILTLELIDGDYDDDSD